MFASLLWMIVALAFGVEAVAQPCDIRMKIKTIAEHEATADMPCHDMMAMQTSEDAPDTPDHQADNCCCAALLKGALVMNAVDVSQPFHGMADWAYPLPDAAKGIVPGDDPPPPRA
ncbi:MAG: hypothetical protein AAFR94_05235 [Pseudomonadota bacterium]